MSVRALPMPVNPAPLKHAEQRRQSLENRVADQITCFTGSMQFAYLHVIWFAAWIGFRVEHYPFGLLTRAIHALTATRSAARRPDRMAPNVDPTVDMWVAWWMCPMKGTVSGP